MGRENCSTAASPLARLNQSRFLRLRNLRIGLVVHVGAELDIVMIDGRRVTLKRTSDVLSQAKVRRAFLDVYGTVLPHFSRRAWLHVAALILASAQVQEIPLAA